MTLSAPVPLTLNNTDHHRLEMLAVKYFDGDVSRALGAALMMAERVYDAPMAREVAGPIGALMAYAATWQPPAKRELNSAHWDPDFWDRAFKAM